MVTLRLPLIFCSIIVDKRVLVPRCRGDHSLIFVLSSQCNPRYRHALQRVAKHPYVLPGTPTCQQTFLRTIMCCYALPHVAMHSYMSPCTFHISSCTPTFCHTLPHFVMHSHMSQALAHVNKHSHSLIASFWSVVR